LLDAIPPVLPSVSALLGALDYLGVFVFAASGALAAAQRKHDIITFAFFAAVTGIGGGTLRDLLIGAPVFWVKDAGYLIACGAATVLVWLIGERLARLRALLWLDAAGLAAYCVIGAAKALAFGVAAPVAVVMGVLTACFGGVLRDVLAGEPSILLRREIYATAALVGASVFVAAEAFGAAEAPALGAGVVAAFAVRAGAIVRGWTLPGFRGGAA
jgi:uncharacterized membrane protein YeiH